METEVRVIPENLETEMVLVWEGVCRILGYDPDQIKKPIAEWASNKLIDLAKEGARYAALGPDKRKIFLAYEEDVYRGHLAHEIAHYLRWHLADYDESEYWPTKVDEDLRFA